MAGENNAQAEVSAEVAVIADAIHHLADAIESLARAQAPEGPAEDLTLDQTLDGTSRR
jgi:hypothetical protein